MKTDMTDDVGNVKWQPEKGWIDVEIVKMVEGVSASKNPKYVINFADAVNPGNALEQSLTNIPGKRWLLRQLLEACGIEPEETKEEFTEKIRKVYDWEISDIEGKTVSALVEHEPNVWTDSNNKVHNDVQAKFVKFQKLSV